MEEPLIKLPTNITPLVDGDWIVFACCMAIEYGTDEEKTPSFDDTTKVLRLKLEQIAHELESSTSPIFFFSGRNNFRKEVAKAKVYKGNRKDTVKPFHYTNVINYVKANYEVEERDDCEADDLMSMYQTYWGQRGGDGGANETCIVTVDKDLRQVNGWHYSPEGHNFPSFGPRYCTDENSFLKPKKEEQVSKGCVGSGYKFFYYQMLVGDSVDNIPGLPKYGPAKSYPLINSCTSERECFEVVKAEYRDVCMMAHTYLKEQAYLLWMVREQDKHGGLVMWEEPDE